MTIVWNLIKAFLVGGALCMIGEILLLKTKLTPARILVGYIVAGVFLSAIGVYAPLAQFAGAGASVPLTGFGHALVTGVKRAVQEIGFLGAFALGTIARTNPCVAASFRRSSPFGTGRISPDNPTSPKAMVFSGNGRFCKDDNTANNTGKSAAVSCTRMPPTTFTKTS